MRKINIFVLVVLLSAGVFAGQVYAKKSKAYGASLTIPEPGQYEELGLRFVGLAPKPS